MRRLDCVLEPKKEKVYELYQKFKDQFDDPSPVILRQIDLPFFNVSKFDLSRITSGQVSLDFNNYVQGYSKNVLDIIESFLGSTLIQEERYLRRINKLED